MIGNSDIGVIMDCEINQAVVFTKPLHHLGLSLTPEQLDRQARKYLEENGFILAQQRKVTGPELAAREVIRQHYLMYSEASYGNAAITGRGKEQFEGAFGQRWDDEVAAGRIMSNPKLLVSKGISAHELYLLWNRQFSDRKTEKIQDGVIIAWIAELDCYCINAFYPAMEENFNHPETRICYYVVEFDPAQVSWECFRKEILGSTNASRAAPGSFRGQLYAEHPVEFPGRDNFVHGSAGPIEGFIERTIHEQDFEMETSPVGRHLAERGVVLETFKAWKSARSISELGSLFDETEEKNCSEALAQLNAIGF